MLTVDENALITRVERDAPAGQLMRRYWLPGLRGDEIEPGRPPVRVRLLGSELLAVRDASGDLALRDAEGTGVRSYPVREAGGLMWTYLGAPELEPAFPAFDWTSLPRTQLAIIKFVQNTNYMQAIEGAIDTVHVWFLHRGVEPDWQHRSALSMDHSPRLEVEDTAYGFRYAAIRRPAQDADMRKWIRVTNVVLPTTVLIPRPLPSNLWLKPSVQVFAPVDDTHTTVYTIFFDLEEPVDEQKIGKEFLFAPGVEVAPNGAINARESNGWKQDRVAMKRGSFTGISGLLCQDVAVQESMGAIVDRSREHLGNSDVAVIRLRRRMLENIRGFIAGAAPIGLDVPIDYARVRSEQRIIGIDELWQPVGAFAGEHAQAQ